MHLTDLGMIAQALALVFAVYAIASSVAGAALGRDALVASGRRAVLVVAGFLIVAALALIFSFTTHDYGAAYVAEHSSDTMPWYYTAAAFYGGQEGSLLYWVLMLALFSSLAVLLHTRAPKVLMPYVVVTLMGIATFFLFVLNFVSSPFARTRIVPQDGQGLNPILQDPGMLVHPPMLLMGYMSFSVPFAFAVAAMITGRLDAGWLRAIRRWTLAAWAIQTTGLLLGAWWAYHVLGWGGYWGWDPVENAALLPWLTATAFLHSALVQERRGTLKVWNLGLIIVTFALSIFGTFEVRSGIINSVHSFATSAIGPYFLGFLAVVIAASLALFVYRLPRLRPEHELESVVSREGSFLLNNLLLAGIAGATLWGTLFPILSEAVRNQTMTVGPTFYEQVNGPLFAALIFVMGIGPLLAWRRASWQSMWRNFRWPLAAAAGVAVALPLLGAGLLWADIGFALCAFAAATILYEVWRGMRVRHGHGETYPVAFVNLVGRHRQRYGGYLVHLGLVVLAVGVIGSHFFQVQGEQELKPNETLHVGAYAITYKGVWETNDSGVDVIHTDFTMRRGTTDLGHVYPGTRTFPGFESQPASVISISTHGLEDVYVFLAGYHGSDTATIHVFVNPLVVFVWLGGILMLLGGIVCWWPQSRRAPRLREPARATAPAHRTEVAV